MGNVWKLLLFGNKTISSWVTVLPTCIPTNQKCTMLKEGNWDCLRVWDGDEASFSKHFFFFFNYCKFVQQVQCHDACAYKVNLPSPVLLYSCIRYAVMLCSSTYGSYSFILFWCKQYYHSFRWLRWGLPVLL